MKTRKKRKKETMVPHTHTRTHLYITHNIINTRPQEIQRPFLIMMILEIENEMDDRM